MSYQVAMFAPRIDVVSAATIWEGVTSSPVFVAGVRTAELARSGTAGNPGGNAAPRAPAGAPVAPRQPARPSTITRVGKIRFTVRDPPASSQFAIAVRSARRLPLKRLLASLEFHPPA